MISEIYKNAEYYEIGFSFVNAKKQVDLFERFIAAYSKRKVKKILDIACGPALQLRELARRGYKSFGLDNSTQMLKYLRKVARREKIEIRTILANMADFTLREKVDFVYNMMDSIIYLKNNDEFLSHLDSVARALSSGGLYLIENLPLTWSDPAFLKPQKWSIKKDGIKIKATYQVAAVDALRQLIRQTISLDINDNGKNIKLVDKDILKLVFPQEFKALVALNGKFEFLGFFERASTRLLKKAKADNIALLRRK